MSMRSCSLNLPDFSNGEANLALVIPEFESLFGQPEQSASDFLEVASDQLTDLDDLSSSPDVGVVPEEDSNTITKTPIASTIPLAEHEAIVDDLNKHHADLMDELVESHRQDVVHHLEKLQSDLADAVAQRLEMSLARVFSGFFQDRLAQSSIDDLVKEVGSIAGSSVFDSLKISGPRPLVAAVLEALGSTEFPIEVEETTAVDITASFNDRHISTRISEWQERLERVVTV